MNLRQLRADALAALLFAVSSVVVFRAAPALGAPPAVAAPPAPSAAPSLSQQAALARLHFQQGVALYQDQNYDAALAEFVGAYGISREPVVLYNMGLTFKSLFRYGEAIETLERYLDESGAKGHPVSKERRAEVEAIVSEMKSLLADVTLVVTPPDAAVRIDGRAVTLGIEGIVKLATGSHAVEASAPDYKPGRQEITVVAGAAQKVTLTLIAIPRTGQVKISASQIGARVRIDGRDAGASPVVVDLVPGGHQLEVTAPGYAASRSELMIAAGQSRDVTITLDLPPPPADTRPIYRRWWFWTGVGVAAAAVGTALLVPERTQPILAGTLGTANTNP